MNIVRDWLINLRENKKPSHRFPMFVVCSMPNQAGFVVVLGLECISFNATDGIVRDVCPVGAAFMLN